MKEEIKKDNRLEEQCDFDEEGINGDSADLNVEPQVSFDSVLVNEEIEPYHEIEIKKEVNLNAFESDPLCFNIAKQEQATNVGSLPSDMGQATGRENKLSLIIYSVIIYYLILTFLLLYNALLFYGCINKGLHINNQNWTDQ